jgi:hypothetical protein
MLQLCYWLECGNVNNFSLHTHIEQTRDVIFWQNYNFFGVGGCSCYGQCSYMVQVPGNHFLHEQLFVNANIQDDIYYKQNRNINNFYTKACFTCINAKCSQLHFIFLKSLAYLADILKYSSPYC